VAGGLPARRASGALVHAHEQLDAHGDACVPAQRQQADVARHDGRPHQVLHRGRAVGVPVKHLRGAGRGEGSRGQT